MKIKLPLIIGITVPIIGVALGVHFLSFDASHYEVKIHGMKDTYQIGETYSFYYTISGYGNTCGGWYVSFPDKNGVIQTRGSVIDCTKIVNKDLNYDSSKDNRKFSSLVPQTSGKYNVTVYLENAQPVVYEFDVLPNKKLDDVENLPTFSYEIIKEDVIYGSSYIISGGIVNDIIYDEISNSLIVSLAESNGGYLQIVIQTGVLHMPRELPFTYFVLNDGEEVEFEELSPIMLKIPFDKGTKQIEIIGANLT